MRVTSLSADDISSSRLLNDPESFSRSVTRMYLDKNKPTVNRSSKCITEGYDANFRLQNSCDVLPAVNKISYLNRPKHSFGIVTERTHKSKMIKSLLKLKSDIETLMDRNLDSVT